MEAGYSEMAIELFDNKVNIGILKDSNLSFSYTGPCGDTMILHMAVGDGKVIDDISFQYIGCPASAASGSALTILVKGKPLKEAGKVTPEEILEYLGGLPKDHYHCPLLAATTLKKAIEVYENRKRLTSKEHDEYVHFCGLTGKELEELSDISCSNCPIVLACENDHTIIETVTDQSQDEFNSN